MRCEVHYTDPQMPNIKLMIVCIQSRLDEIINDMSEKGFKVNRIVELGGVPCRGIGSFVYIK